MSIHNDFNNIISAVGVISFNSMQFIHFQAIQINQKLFTVQQMILLLQHADKLKACPHQHVTVQSILQFSCSEFVDK